MANLIHIKPSLGDKYSFEHLNHDVSLRQFSDAAGYRILKISLALGNYLTPVVGNPLSTVKEEQTIKVVAVLCNLTDGKILYLPIFPYYRVNKKDFCLYPDSCDDVIIRFTLRRDCRGFFLPKWISCYHKNERYAPYQSGSNRIDYAGIGENRITYAGFNAMDAVGSNDGMKKALSDVFLAWLSTSSSRTSLEDPLMRSGITVRCL